MIDAKSEHKKKSYHSLCKLRKFFQLLCLWPHKLWPQLRKPKQHTWNGTMIIKKIVYAWISIKSWFHMICSGECIYSFHQKMVHSCCCNSSRSNKFTLKAQHPLMSKRALRKLPATAYNLAWTRFFFRLRQHVKKTIGMPSTTPRWQEIIGWIFFLFQSIPLCSVVFYYRKQNFSSLTPVWPTISGGAKLHITNGCFLDLICSTILSATPAEDISGCKS